MDTPQDEPGPTGERYDLGDALTLAPEDLEPDSQATTMAGAKGRPARGLDALLQVRGESKTLGRYIVMGTLGRGGMGTVLRAFDPKLDRRVAIKVLHRELGAQQTQRLLREAQALARLSHPNVVQVYEVDEREGQAFVVMELVSGQTLDQWLSASPRPTWRQCVEVFIQVGEGLAAAHEQGLVHRDFKPSNAILDERGRARVLDFGLARQVGADEDEVPAPSDSEREDSLPLKLRLTRTGAMLGTPAYMPPEQMSGQGDARSDQFSFCVSLYEALYRERPFDGDSVAEILGAVVQGQIRSAPSSTRVPRALRRILVRGLATDPDQRWPSMDALLAQLRRRIAPRGRRWAGLAALGTGLTMLGAGLWYQAEAGQRCSGAAAQLHGIWDDTHRRDVRQAIVGTELPFAPATWDRVEQRLDEYTAAWISTHTDACEATAVRQEQSDEDLSLRMRCLRERKTALGAVVEVMAHADAQAVENAVSMLSELPPVAHCSDVDRLRRDDHGIVMPDDPDQRRAIEAFEAREAEVAAHRAAGHYDRAKQQIGPLVEEARALGFAPALVSALFEHAGVADDHGQLSEAEDGLREVYSLSLESGYDKGVADAAQALVYVVGFEQARPEEAQIWAQTALSMSQRRGDEDSAVWTRHNVALSLSRAGRYEQAEREFQRVREQLDAQEHPDDLKVADNTNGLGNIYLRSGRYEDAEREFQRARELRERALGAEHPHVAGSLNNLGTVSLRRGRYEEAERRIRRALELWQRALGDEHREAALGMNNLGAVLRQQGRHEEAAGWYRRALEIKQRLLGENHPDVAATMGNLGMTLYSLGQHDEAERWLRRSLELKERVLGPDHSSVAYSHVGLVKILLARDEFEAAVIHGRRAVSIREASGAATELLAEARFWLARALDHDSKQRAEARRLAALARESLSHSEDSDRQALLVEIDRWLAERSAP